MTGFIAYIKVNLLGIAVAIGVCSFLYEALISHTGNFTLTEIAALLIFVIATDLKIKDNKKRRHRLQKSQTKQDKSDEISAQN